MPVLRIKAPRRSRAELMARAKEKADALLHAEDGACDSDRVLVVYGAEAAAIYYEGTQPSTRTR